MTAQDPLIKLDKIGDQKITKSFKEHGYITLP